MLDRLLRPKSIAVIGGGAWCAAIIEQTRKLGFAGPVWPVHPTRDQVGGLAAYASSDALPDVPDACFIGVNRHATIDVVGHLSTMGAGGAVCFASGFAEAQAEDPQAADLQAALLEAAGDMPIIGPNCYGYVNYLDGAGLWPDQHGGQRVTRGVALITQSSNIAINLTMQRRGLPIAYVMTVGNQAQTSMAQLVGAALDDPRVTAVGMYIEGLKDLPSWHALAQRAQDLGKPLVALKVGASDQAQAATVSHTASLAGSQAGARALFARLGIGLVDSLPVLLEALKILHFGDPLPGRRLASMSSSGGEASIVADTALRYDIDLPPLSPEQHQGLRAALGPMVALANPLDYHTYIWAQDAAMQATFAAMAAPHIDLVALILDIPREDRCDASTWWQAAEAASRAAKQSGQRMAILSTLPDCMTEAQAQRIADLGLIPLIGIEEMMAAMRAAAACALPLQTLPALPRVSSHEDSCLIHEAEAKRRLAAYGLSVPLQREAKTAEQAAEAATELGFPVVLKGQGLAHKSEAGAVKLGLKTPAEVLAAAQVMPCDSFLIEQVINDAVAELLVGITLDPAHGYVLTLGAGGVLTEILADTQSLLLPADRADLTAVLQALRLAPILAGYRGKPGADIEAVLDAIEAVQAFALAHLDQLIELEINPLLCCPQRAVAVDALLRLVTPHMENVLS